MDISIYGWREEARREVQQRFGVVAREGYGMSETCLKSEGEPWCRLGRIRWPMFGPADWSRHFTPLNEPYWKSLAEGRLTYQRCRSCGHA